MVGSDGAADWSRLLVDQVDWHWRHQARPRLDGLSDKEYRWEPAPGSWNVHPRGSGPPPGSVEVGSGAGVIDHAFPEPVPAPVTTIAWRLCHVVVGVLSERNARYFDGPPITYDTYDYPLGADAALAGLVLHINRELVHHLAEVALLRDLWAHAGRLRPGRTEPAHR